MRLGFLHDDVVMRLGRVRRSGVEVLTAYREAADAVATRIHGG
jgi:hypothetical protein